jgi:hypothetical protein
LIYVCTHTYVIRRLLVLSSQSRQRPVTFSLTTPTPQPTAGEAAINDLLRVVRNPRANTDPRSQPYNPVPGSQTRTPSFLSGGLPRDRRGRIAQKQSGKGPPQEEDKFGDETRRVGPTSYVADVERAREREFLEALRYVEVASRFGKKIIILHFRSPDLVSSTARASVGGWGLGAGHEDAPKTAEEEEDDEPLDWDQAQEVVERMVGMTRR